MIGLGFPSLNFFIVISSSSDGGISGVLNIDHNTVVKDKKAPI